MVASLLLLYIGPHSGSAFSMLVKETASIIIFKASCTEFNGSLLEVVAGGQMGGCIHERLSEKCVVCASQRVRS